jgi:hypothetical protein
MVSLETYLNSRKKIHLSFNPITDFKIPYTDLKALIGEYVKHLWQTGWNKNKNNKLHGINSTVSTTVILKRRDEVVTRDCLY